MVQEVFLSTSNNHQHIRRQNSQEVLNKFSLSVSEALPLLDEKMPALKSTDDIADRMLCISSLVALSFHPQESEKIHAWIEREKLKEKMTDEEKAFLNGDSKNINLIRWQVESLFAFSWACSLQKTYRPMDILPGDLYSLFPSIKEDESSKLFRDSIALRAAPEMLDVLDLYYCLHSAIRGNQLEGKKTKIPIHESAVTERRKAMEWIFSSDRWEAISLDT
jgi:hypothetical protein